MSKNNLKMSYQQQSPSLTHPSTHTQNKTSTFILHFFFSFTRRNSNKRFVCSRQFDLAKTNNNEFVKKETAVVAQQQRQQCQVNTIWANQPATTTTTVEQDDN